MEVDLRVVLGGWFNWQQNIGGWKRNHTNGRLTMFLPPFVVFMPIKKAEKEWSSSSMSITSTRSSTRRLGWRPSRNDVLGVVIVIVDEELSLAAWVWWNQATAIRLRPMSAWTLLRWLWLWLWWPPRLRWWWWPPNISRILIKITFSNGHDCDAILCSK